MAEDSKCLCACNEVRGASMVNSTDDALSYDAGGAPRRRRRNRSYASQCSIGASQPPETEWVGEAADERDEPREIVQAIIRWYIPQESATKERVIELQQWLRRLRIAENLAANKAFAHKVKDLMQKYEE